MPLAFNLRYLGRRKRIHVAGTVAASGNYSTSADTLDLSQVLLIASTQPPINGTAWMAGGPATTMSFFPARLLSAAQVKVGSGLFKGRSRGKDLLTLIPRTSTGSSISIEANSKNRLKLALPQLPLSK